MKRKTPCCYLEIYWKGKWRWQGTYYDKTFKAAIKSAIQTAEHHLDGEPKDWRIKLGEPRPAGV